MKLFRYKYVPSAMVATILYALLNVLHAYSLSFLVVDTISQLISNFLVVLMIYIAYSLALYFKMRRTALAESYLTEIFSQINSHYFANQSFQEFHKLEHGEHLSSYINDIPKIIELTLKKYLNLIEMATMAIASFIALCNIHYTMGILAFISFTLMSVVPKLFQSRLSNYISGLQTQKAQYTSKMRELLQGFTTFFENQAFTIFLKKAQLATTKYANYLLETQTFTGLMSATLTFVNALVSLLSIVYVSYLVLTGQVAAGALLAVLSLVPEFGSAVIQLISEREFYQSGVHLFKERLPFALGQYQIPKYQVNVEPSKTFHTLKLTNITLPYKKILKLPDITFSLGQNYAIVGESGSGKSSLLKILIGEIDYYQGEVWLDQQLKNPKHHLFSMVSYMNQETFLFNDTIKNNIDLLGTLSNTEVQNLLSQVGLGNLAPEMMIQDNGKNLSGGQRQRIAFARAIARKKDILILDEACANLDAQSAQIIEKLAFQSAKTVLMITHQMSEEVKAKTTLIHIKDDSNDQCEIN